MIEKGNINALVPGTIGRLRGRPIQVSSVSSDSAVDMYGEDRTERDFVTRLFRAYFRKLMLRVSSCGFGMLV